MQLSFAINRFRNILTTIVNKLMPKLQISHLFCNLPKMLHAATMKHRSRDVNNLAALRSKRQTCSTSLADDCRERYFSPWSTHYITCRVTYELILLTIARIWQFLRPSTKLGQGYIFTGVCDFVHGGGGSAWAGPPRTRCQPPGPGTHPSRPGTPRD